MQRHSNNDQRVAKFLASYPSIERVNYPDLPVHPQQALACRRIRSGGGMLSFVAPSGIEAAGIVLDGLKLITRAVTFGKIRTICMHPATSTHEHMTSEEREKAGIPDGLIRLSVGLEEADDIINDLQQALSDA
jgi:cystathionine beta-lyase/cystathionine gamma-synthase